ncbi:MAG: hypothetical protein WC436_02000 [Candidatus Babeliales bacterium]
MKKNIILKSFISLLLLFSCVNIYPKKPLTPLTPPTLNEEEAIISIKLPNTQQISLPQNTTPTEEQELKPTELISSAAIVPQSNGVKPIFAEFTDPNISKTVINLSQYKELLTDRDLIAIAHAHPLLEEIDISGCTEISDTGLRAVGQFCQALQKINISNCHSITDNGILWIASDCRALNTINLSHCSITDIGLTALRQIAPNIKTLNLSNCNEFTGEGLGRLLSFCNNLERLVLENCPVTMLELALLNIPQQTLNRKFKQLNINGCNLLNSDAISDFFSKCKKLEDLCIDTSQLDNEIIRSIANNCRKLSNLCIKQLTNKQKPYHSYINQSIVRRPSIQFSDSSVQILAEKCKNLKNLDFSSCTYITDLGLGYLAQLKKLTELYLPLQKNDSIRYSEILREIQNLKRQLPNLTIISGD